MTEPSQYFKGRTVQEQMNEVIGYVDVRAEEVAAAKADDVLEPAEQAKDDAIAAKKDAEQARDVTLAALPTIQQDITDLKAEDVALDGRLDTVELKVQTAEGNIVTIQGQIVALQTADGQNVKINNINNYALGLTGNQNSTGTKGFTAIKTPYIEVENNFRPVIYYGDYDGSDVQTSHRIRPITIFTSPNNTKTPILRMEALDDESITGVELTTTIYNTNVTRGISLYARKSDGMAYVTVPSRGSTNVGDYTSNEVVTIDTLRKLRLIQ